MHLPAGRDDDACSCLSVRLADELPARVRRSLHFVPGANEALLSKSLATAADGLVLDLEDAVTPDRKADARKVIASWLEDVEFGRQERIVRMNPLDTPWGIDDLRVTMAHPPDAYLVPKVATLAELETIDRTLTDLEKTFGHTRGAVKLLLVATETPSSVINLPTFCDCSRVAGLAWGAEDLSAALGAPTNRAASGEYLDVYKFCRVQTLLCAAAGGVDPIDAVYVNFKDGEGLAAECAEGAAMGFTGKITIHPAQIDIVNAAFTPDSATVAEAAELLAAFDAAAAEGRMAFSFKGQMVDAPHLSRAQKTLARARHLGISVPEASS